MKRITSGFTLIELMIVVAIIAIIAAIAIPNLLAARLSANETSAVANMRTISSAQGQFQIAAKADVDGDGTGEYGMFRELCAAAPVRTTALGTSTGSALRTPILSAAFRSLSSAGRVHQSGYAYRLWLHGTNGSAIGEGSLTLLQGGGGSIDTEMSETTWCVYAASLGYARSGNRPSSSIRRATSARRRAPPTRRRTTRTPARPSSERGTSTGSPGGRRSAPSRATATTGNR